MDGQGYPLASLLWDHIKQSISQPGRDDIQTQLDGGAEGLEAALDLLDRGQNPDMPLRHEVAAAIAAMFRQTNAPLNSHKAFLRRLAAKGSYCERVFSLNYDPLVELAAVEERVRVVDGFTGSDHAYFDPQVFRECSGRKVSKRGRWACDRFRGRINLYKLHGSLGWYYSPVKGVRRCSFSADLPDGARQLMITPQYRKASDTVVPPYAQIWSDFRALLVHGPELLNRLVCIGYGMGDEHVNAVIEAALDRSNFTLLIAARVLTDPVVARWSRRSRVIIVTESRSALYGEIGSGHPQLWSLEGLCQEMTP
jgi:hypothetical protein